MQVRDNLTVETLPLRIEDRKVKKLRGKEIPLVKVVWGGVTGENLTWEYIYIYIYMILKIGLNSCCFWLGFENMMNC